MSVPHKIDMSLVLELENEVTLTSRVIHVYIYTSRCRINPIFQFCLFSQLH